jgi:tetratricopeptide (TPR) repeat protein
LNSKRSVFLAGGLIVLAALVAYGNSFSGPFVFDDLPSIADNPTIRHFGSALSPPVESTTGGRPVLNLSLALNYAISGNAVWSYHALNLLIHIFAGLTLFGLVRRTLLRLELSKCGRGAPTPQSAQMRGEGTPPTLASPTSWAFFVAVIWVVHPLQTESVTYVVQRAESLMGLFYLLTLYCFVRVAESRSQASGVGHQVSEARNQEKELKTQNQEAVLPLSSGLMPDASCLWFSASILSCAMGMASKEVMASAPLIVLLYDRTFVAGSFRAAWQSRWRYYLGLACTWLLLGYLVAGTHGRAGSAGFGTNVSWWSYAFTQFPAIVHYLWLAFWPNPLVFYYGTGLAMRAAEIVPYAAIVLALAIGTVVALWRRPVVGFLGCWFFAILAPSSSIVPVATQTMAEHRMYLPLAAVVLLVLSVLYRLLGRRAAYAGVGLAILLTGLTLRRNEDYRSDIGLWKDTATKCPDNERAFYNLGCSLEKESKQRPEAIAAYEAALRIKPDYAQAHYNLGTILLKEPDRTPEAIAAYEAALRINPGYAEAHNNLGTALLKTPGRLPDAIAQYEAALRINPDYAQAHFNLGNALREVPGRLPDAIAQYETALRIEPDSVQAHVNLGSALLKMPERLPDAIDQFQAALRLDPDLVEAHNDLGNALFNLPGRLPDAIDQYEAALRLNPDSVSAHFNLGMALLKMPGRTPDAIDQFKAALRLNPDLKPAKEMLDQLAR